MATSNKRFFRELRAEAYSASGAIAVRPHRPELDSSGGALVMTVGAPGAGMVGKVLPITLTNADNGATVQYTGPGGSVTESMASVGDALVLLAVTATAWAPMISPYLTQLNASNKGAAYTQTYSTADRTIAARTAAALTENSGAIGGTNDGDLPDLTATAAALTENSGAIGGTNDGDLPALVDPSGDSGASVIAGIRENSTMINALVADNIALRAAIRELAAMINATVVDNVDTTQAVNAIIDDLQANGLAS